MPGPMEEHAVPRGPPEKARGSGLQGSWCEGGAGREAAGPPRWGTATPALTLPRQGHSGLAKTATQRDLL